MGDGVVGGVEKNDPIFLGWVAPVAERPYFLSIKSDISFLPSYYSLVDNSISAKLHQLGRRTLVRSAPKFFAKKKKLEE